MWFYRVFKLSLASELELPELGEALARPQAGGIAFRFAEDSGTDAVDWYHHWEDEDGRRLFSAGRGEDCYYLHFPDAALFCLKPRAGTIDCCREDDCDEASLRHLLLDQVIPRLLALRQALVLHGSAVRVGDGLIVLAGPSGAGKSTLAASFLSAAYHMVTDDCLLLETGETGVHGTASYPGLRLWPDSCELLPGLESRAGPVGGNSEKQRYIDVSTSHPVSETAAVRALFLLCPAAAESVEIEPAVSAMGGAGAAIALLGNTFRMHFSPTEEAVALAHVARLLESGLLVYQLAYPRDYSRLPEVRCAILESLN